MIAGILAAALLGGLAGVLAVNGLVRLAGGEPGWLEPERIEARAAALGWLARHLAADVVGECGGSAREALRRAAERARIPAALVVAIAEVESGAQSHRVSRAGAMGPMQLTADTARRFGVDDPFAVDEAARGGAAYLAWLWRRYAHDVVRVAAAYNAGPGAIDGRPAHEWPRETQAYVARVRARFAQLGGASGPVAAE